MKLEKDNLESHAADLWSQPPGAQISPSESSLGGVHSVSPKFPSIRPHNQRTLLDIILPCKEVKVLLFPLPLPELFLSEGPARGHPNPNPSCLLGAG